MRTYTRHVERKRKASISVLSGFLRGGGSTVKHTQKKRGTEAVTVRCTSVWLKVGRRKERGGQKRASQERSSILFFLLSCLFVLTNSKTDKLKEKGEKTEKLTRKRTGRQSVAHSVGPVEKKDNNT